MMDKIGKAMDCAGNRIRALLLAAAGNVSLFLFAAFLSTSFLGSELFTWHSEATAMFERYVVVPWGMALCLLRLERRNRLDAAPRRWDLGVLFVLLMWVIVPYGIRFGMTFNNMGSWQAHCAGYFGLYAMLSEQTREQRERLFDQACVLFGAFSLVMGGALLYCAVTGARIDSNWIVHYGTYNEGGFSFGVFERAHLCTGLHYNITGMMALPCAMFSLAGMFRSKNKLMRFGYLLAAVMMMIVIVLTQSRTSRYVLIAALGAGVYGWLTGTRRLPNLVIRHAAGLLAAAVVMVSAYVGASMLNDAALKHYADLENQKTVSVIPVAVAEETKDQQEKPLVEAKEARVAVDATLSGRTDIWRNLVNYWKENPKELFIGAGIGKIGSRIVKGTIHEENGSVAIHNSYLQHTADFGLIGSGLLALFLMLILAPVLRVFYAAGDHQTPGYRVLCMLVVASLLTGLMESATFGAMTGVNSTMLFALALLVPRGMEIKAGK